MPTAPRTHRPHGAPQKRDYRISDRYRGTAASRGYTSQWSKEGGTRDQAMQRDCYLCQMCARKGITHPASAVDHIIPTHVRPDLMHDMDNLQALCRACHTAKTHEDNERYGSREAAVLSVEQRRARAAVQGQA